MHSNVGHRFRREQPGTGRESASGELADVLEDPHCRHLLEYLRDEEGPVPEWTLARHVVARITGRPPGDVETEVTRRVQTWLHHGQLPILDEYGAVEFDAEAGEVSLGREDAY